MAELTYLYAVAHDRLPSCPPGVADAPVRTVAGSGLVAYVSTVPVEQFGAEPLRRSLEDLDWLSETARAHHRVVDAVAAATTTAPVRLATVYADDTQVAALLERRGGAFELVLAKVSGRQEWGVKAYAAQPGDPDEQPAPRTDTPTDMGASGSGGVKRAGRVCGGDRQAVRPGTADLHRRRTGLSGREQARRQALQRADHIHRALTALAAAGRRHHAQAARLSGRHQWMLLNGAYLVDESRAEEFTELAGRLGGDGVRIRLTGPWAPYSFTIMA